MTAASQFAAERELVLSLLPATMEQLIKKTGLSQRRVEIALREMWFVHGVYEQPTNTAEIE